MSEGTDGGLAFPARAASVHQGMTLRDYFAAAALQGMLAADPKNIPAGATLPDIQNGTAKAAYALADAMLKARGEGQ